MKKLLHCALLGLLLVLPLSSCATLMFPERQNEEHSDKLDPNMLIFDSIGLLFFILPGVVAFTVDFVTGAIYLPDGLEKGEGPFFWDKGVTPIQEREESK